MSAFVLSRGYELQLPNNYVDIDADEMEYIDGGISYSSAKSILYGAIGAAITRIVGRAITQSAIGAVINSIGSWFAGTIDTAILTVWYNPVAAAVAAAGVVGTIYSVGHWRLHKW
jgi:hypothetical protein